MPQRLSNDQFELLSALSRKPIPYSDISDKSVFNYLCEQGYVYYVIERIDDRDVPAYAAVTQEGLCYLATVADEDRKFRQTRNIAIAALVISFISALFTGLTYLAG